MESWDLVLHSKSNKKQKVLLIVLYLYTLLVKYILLYVTIIFIYCYKRKRGVSSLTWPNYTIFSSDKQLP